MAMKHVLLKRASTYPRVDSRSIEPPGCHYDARIGAWIKDSDGELFINSPNREGPRTKKEDIETGEDQKGE